MLIHNKPEHIEALVEPTRLRIANLLAAEEMQPGDLAEILSLQRSTLAHHLGKLKSAGMLTTRRGNDGRSVFYSLADHPLLNEAKELLVRVSRIAPYSADLKKLRKYRRKTK